MPENLFTPNSIRTYTGKYINVINPDPALFCIKDMAHALARTARFGGHLPFMYSVAQHSLAGMQMAPDHLKLEVLMHDTPEYILVDLPSPIKKLCGEYKVLEDNIAREISKKYHLQYPLPQAVKDIDMQLLVTEWEALFIKPLPFYKKWWPFRIFWEINYPRRVEKKFIKAFYKLYNERIAQQAHAASTT